MSGDDGESGGPRRANGDGRFLLEVPEAPEPLTQSELDGWFATSPAELDRLRSGQLTPARLRRLGTGCLPQLVALASFGLGAWAGWLVHPLLSRDLVQHWPAALTKPLFAPLLGLATAAVPLLLRWPAARRRRAELARLPVQIEALALKAEMLRGPEGRVTGVGLRAADGRLFRAPLSPRSLRVAGRYTVYWVDLAQLASTPEDRRGPFVVALELL